MAGPDPGTGCGTGPAPVTGGPQCILGTGPGTVALVLWNTGVVAAAVADELLLLRMLSSTPPAAFSGETCILEFSADVGPKILAQSYIYSFSDLLLT